MTASILFIVGFLQFFLTGVQGEDTFDCTGHEDDSFHPIYNTDNCRQYWQCIYVDTVYMRAVKRVCPAGTEFDIRLRECEISSLVNCVPPKSHYMPQTSVSTIAWTWKHSKLVSHQPWKPTVSSEITTNNHRLPDLKQSKTTDVTTLTMPSPPITTQQMKVLNITSSQLTTVFSLEQLLKNLYTIALHHHSNKSKSSSYIIKSEVYHTTIQSTYSHSTDQSTSIQTLSKVKRQQLGHRHRTNKTLYILTSNEHRIRQFSINQTHGILINCNEIRRRHLRDLIFRTTTTARTNSSSKMFDYNILSLTIFIISFSYFYKNK